MWRDDGFGQAATRLNFAQEILDHSFKQGFIRGIKTARDSGWPDIKHGCLL
jgi:hypothetical protein